MLEKISFPGTSQIGKLSLSVESDVVVVSDATDVDPFRWFIWAVV